MTKSTRVGRPKLTQPVKSSESVCDVVVAMKSKNQTSRSRRVVVTRSNCSRIEVNRGCNHRVTLYAVHFNKSIQRNTPPPTDVTGAGPAFDL